MKTFLEMALLPGLSFRERLRYMHLHLGLGISLNKGETRDYVAIQTLARYGFRND